MSNNPSLKKSLIELVICTPIILVFLYLGLVSPTTSIDENSAVNELQKYLKGFFSSPETRSFPSHLDILLGTQQPIISNYTNNEMQQPEQWKIDDITFSTINSGMGMFQDKKYPAAIVKMNIHWINRILAKRSNYCFVVSDLNDTDFNVLRNIDGVECGDKEEEFITRFKQDVGFH
ncbi:hypothetical protein [Entomobacter blattae]|nr:hypothetical protein [Entomobacter blattae]